MKLLAIPLVLALAGAGFSGAVLTGQIPLFAPQTSSSEAPLGWTLLEEFTGDAGDLTTGSIDFRTFTGNIQVVGWEESSYVVSVYQRVTEGGQQLGDAGVEAVFTEDAGDALDLGLVVRPTGTAGINLNAAGSGHRIGGGGPQMAVVAFVPAALSWDTVTLCSGSGGFFGDTVGQLFGTLLGREAEHEAACIEEARPMNMDISVGGLGDDSSTERESIPFAVEGLHGGELLILAEYGDLTLAGVAFDQVAALTQYGDILANLEGASADLMSQYGDVAVSGVVDELKANTQYGDVLVFLTGGESGSIGVHSQYGDILVAVPQGPDRGYDASAATQYGEVEIILSNAAKKEDGKPAAPATGLRSALVPGLPFLGDEGSRDKGDHGSKHAEARSAGFDDLPVQVVIKAMTQYGDVLITDEPVEHEEDDDGSR